MKTFSSSLLALTFAAPLALAACAESAGPPTEDDMPADTMMGNDTGDAAPVSEPEEGGMPNDADYGEDGMQGAPPVEDSEGLDPENLADDGDSTRIDGGY